MKQLVLFSMFVAAPVALMGAPLMGILNLSGATNQQVAVGPCSSGFCIDFDFIGTYSGDPQLVTGGTMDGGPGGTALFDITNNFATVNSGTSTQVTVKDLNSTSDAPGATVSYGGFITFNLNPTWSVTLSEVLPGADPSDLGSCFGPLVGGTLLNPGTQSCTPPGTPFNEQNTCVGSTASNCTVDVNFSFVGTATNGTDTSQVIGKFSTTFSGTDYQIINTDIAGGHDVVTSDSGTVNFTFSSVPEPMTSGMIGIGLTLLGLLGRKRRMNR